jgi:hypothetical protein
MRSFKPLLSLVQFVLYNLLGLFKKGLLALPQTALKALVLFNKVMSEAHCLFTLTQSSFFGSALLVIPLGEVLDALLDPIGILGKLIVSDFYRGFLHGLAPTVLFWGVVYDLNLGVAFDLNLQLFLGGLFGLNLVWEFEFSHVLLLMPA